MHALSHSLAHSGSLPIHLNRLFVHGPRTPIYILWPQVQPHGYNACSLCANAPRALREPRARQRDLLAFFHS